MEQKETDTKENMYCMVALRSSSKTGGTWFCEKREGR